MARTPLAQSIEDAAFDVGATTGRTTRRELIARAGLAGLGVAALGRFAPVARGAAPPSVAVFCAGLAGLTAARRLRQAGIAATVYEASERLGGRCWTGRGTFAEGQLYEHGGELIDNGHLQTKHLVQELGLQLDNLVQAEAPGTELLGYFDGEAYTRAEMSSDLKTIWQQLHKDVSAASYPTTYTISTPRGRELDQLSITDWIERYVPGGLDSRLGRLLDVAYTIEYGADSSEQSVLNMLYLLGYVGPGQFRIFGKSNEKYHVRGGNDLVVDRLAAGLEGQVETGQELVAIAETGGGRYTLTFRTGSGTTTVTVDHVILTVPFSIMRESVDWSQAGFGTVKATAIEEMGMGTNSKLHLQFTDRHWRTLAANGETYSDRGYQCTWEVSRAQPGAAGILVDYTGGTIGASFGQGTPTTRAQQFLEQLEPVLPGISAKWNGHATVDFWPGYEWTKGSYSYWKVGQYTSFGGVEGERSGNCHFAGEHTSLDFQGYLNGAIETGERAAAEVLGDLK